RGMAAFGSRPGPAADAANSVGGDSRVVLRQSFQRVCVWSAGAYGARFGPWRDGANPNGVPAVLSVRRGADDVRVDLSAFPARAALERVRLRVATGRDSVSHVVRAHRRVIDDGAVSIARPGGDARFGRTVLWIVR